MEYLKSLLLDRVTLNVSTSPTYDLPVNPLSHIDIDVEAVLNAAFTQATVANLAAIFNRIDVMFKGTSIVSLKGLDLAAYTAAIQGKFSPIINRDMKVAAVMVFRLRIPFGRYPYSSVECFPAVRRGELVLRYEVVNSFTNIASATITATTTELIGAQPKQFLKATTTSLTPIVGDNDVDLPLGNKLAGVLLFSTTVPAGVASTTSIDKVKLLRDNVEHYLHTVRWPCLNQKLYEILGWSTPVLDHKHRENAATAYTQNAETNNMQSHEEPLSQFGFIDFDPLRNDAYFLDTVGAGRIWLRITGGDTNPIRVIPIELIEVPAAA